MLKKKQEMINVRNIIRESVDKVLLEANFAGLTAPYVIRLAQHCKSLNEFCRRFPYEYAFAAHYNLLPFCTTSNIQLQKKDQTKSKYYQVAKQCKTYSEFYQKNKSYFKYAQSRGLLKDLDWLENDMEKIPARLTVKNAIEELKNYETVQQLIKDNHPLYTFCLRHKLLSNQNYPKMARPHTNYHTKKTTEETMEQKIERCIEVAKQYKYIEDFKARKNYYLFAVKNDLLKDFNWLKNKPNGLKKNTPDETQNNVEDVKLSKEKQKILDNCKSKAKYCKTLRQFQIMFRKEYQECLENDLLKYFTEFSDNQYAKTK